MNLTELSIKYNIPLSPEFLSFVDNSDYEIKRGIAPALHRVSDDEARKIARDFSAQLEKIREEKEKQALADQARRQSEQADRERRRRAASSILITSGFNFDGYHVVKYSGYISGDDVIQISRGADGIFSSAKNVGEELSKSLVQIRRNALAELKEAALDLGCNAVIGVDFDYITLDPETANFRGGTTYLPYVFCVTANGNAVVIEKNE